MCNQEARTEWANISKKYLKDITDYIELCKPCHEVFDNKRHDNFRGRKHKESSKKKISRSLNKHHKQKHESRKTISTPTRMGSH